MENKFTPSVNIIRDLDKNFNYIHTPNAERVLEQLDNGFSAGIHSFNIIGSFGTGKSSFLLAFEKQLKGEKKFFTLSPSALNGLRPFKFINITDYDSRLSGYKRWMALRICRLNAATLRARSSAG